MHCAQIYIIFQPTFDIWSLAKASFWSSQKTKMPVKKKLLSKFANKSILKKSSVQERGIFGVLRMHHSEVCGRRLCLVLLEFILDKIHWHRMRHLINIPVSAFHVATWPSSMVMLVTPHLEYTTFLLKQSWSDPSPLMSHRHYDLPWCPEIALSATSAFYSLRSSFWPLTLHDFSKKTLFIFLC